MPMTSTNAYAATVQSFYAAFFGRPADRDGLAFWTRQFEAADGQFAAIGAAFAQSHEALIRFGNVPLPERVAGIYETLFSRAPEADGLRFWIDAVEGGHVPLEGVALAILQGAQGSDRDLALLRLDAASRFTQRVEPGAADYHGYTGIEAGRILLRAVTADATPGQLDALVTSSLRLANVLSDHPAVMEALAPGRPLLELFDAGRWSADPALLTEALDLIAASAADRPTLMRQLLRKGGVAEVLDDMPARIDLQSLVELLRQDGLKGLLDLAYPPPVTQPDPEPEPEPEPDPPTLTAIGYGTTDHHLAIGETIALRLVFSDTVQAAAGTRLLLNNGGAAIYTGGNGSNTLVFTYTVQSGDSIADLALAISGALDGGIANRVGAALAAASLDGLNPAGVVIVDGEQTSVTITAGVDGLRIVADKPGDVLIEDASGQRVQAHAGDGAAPVDVVLGERATGSLTGTVLVQAPSGNIGNAPGAIVVALGSNAGQDLAGQYVWGHGGDDVIDGTAAGDLLFGGDGNDTIRAGAGRDVIHGGRGGDTIDLGADNDVDRLVHGAGESSAGLPLFQDGDQTAHIDKVDHLGVGDIVDLGRPFAGVPVWRDTYLSGLDPNEIALVRGSASGGRFVQGDAAADDDFMLQWVTDDVVGSAILRDVGSRAEFTIDRAAGTLTLAAPTPAMSLVKSVSYSSLLGDVVTATFESLPDPVTHTPGSETGLANRDGFSLLNYREFAPLPTDPGHHAAPGFGLRDNVLSLNGPLASNLYSMFWTNDTFDTTAGHLATGQVFFAGGHNNGFDNDGFAVVGMRTMSRDTAFTDAVPWAIFGHASGAASLVTGSGNDVVLSKSGALTVVYAGIDAGAEDLILDFDPAKDRIGLAGDLRAAVDDNGDGFDWLGGSGGQLVVGAGIDAVEVTLIDPAAVVSSAASLQQQTLDTLNGALDVSELARGGDILILARHAGHGGSAALLYFRAQDDHGVIDADELTFIATFNGGAPTMGDLELVAVPPPSP
ncbi:calcium-binding protein [Massilia sp. HP4]|uniref:calcium-binding protein n=1 Tax=Massilia sp. HP4 TaxID=2562316 RepID=UPI0010BFD5BB|nr:calcium-binding protein [Massilia sp. HP4]